MKIKEAVSGIYDLFDLAIEAMDVMQKALFYSSGKILSEAAGVAQTIRERCEGISPVISREADGSVRPYVTVPASMLKIAEWMDKMSHILELKIKEDLYFSDRAVSELNYMFEKTRDIFANTRDMVLARNTVIASYIIESKGALSRTANDFATFHEDRLIEGLCMPKSSPLYLGLMDAFKGMALHAAEIARALSK